MSTMPAQPSEPRTIWGKSVFTERPSTRMATEFAAFFLRYLQPGMRLLDCGCGSGSITLGLAPSVDPGEVVGIDVEPAQIELANNSLAATNLANLRFEVANLYELPFPAASFDAVYCCAVLFHLREPDKALQEMRRVLKPGGLIGVRYDDLDGYLIAPTDPLLLQAWDLFGELVQHNGGNPRAGKHLRARLHAAGFTNVEATATFMKPLATRQQPHSGVNRWSLFYKA